MIGQFGKIATPALLRLDMNTINDEQSELKSRRPLVPLHGMFQYDLTAFSLNATYDCAWNRCHQHLKSPVRRKGSAQGRALFTSAPRSAPAPRPAVITRLELKRAKNQTHCAARHERTASCIEQTECSFRLSTDTAAARGART